MEVRAVPTTSRLTHCENRRLCPAAGALSVSSARQFPVVVTAVSAPVSPRYRRTLRSILRRLHAKRLFWHHAVIAGVVL
jgi:hypothetical protein